MTNIIIIPPENATTMSSREIAELTEKRHDHVLRDIEKMLQDIADPKIGVSDFRGSYTDTTGRNLKEYHLPKDLTITLITGYRADLRYKVVKRLEQYEAGSAVLDLENPAQLRGLLSVYTERTEKAEALVLEQTPKVEALNRLESCEGALVPRLASKTLDYPERKLTKWLEINGWAFRQSGKGPLQAYSEKRKQGFLDHRIDTYQDQRSGEDKARTQLLITPKGMSRLAQVLPH